MRKIKNTAEGGRGTYIGSRFAADGTTPIEREHIVFSPGVVTDIDDAKLAEAMKDPIVRGWFDDGTLVEQTPAAKVEAKTAAEPKKEEPKK